MKQQGIQIFTVPLSGSYEINACGAGNIKDYSKGAKIKGNVALQAGDKLHFAIGQQGKHQQSGSGGTFIFKECDGQFEPLIVAGGAGGGVTINKSLADARLDKFGGPSTEYPEVNTIEGSTGKPSSEQYTYGGKGFKCFKEGITGQTNSNGASHDHPGGFGGGGHGYSKYGGGGGYTGGNGSGSGSYAGGGGSFNSDINGSNTIGHSGDGNCFIRLI
jgi:hypothetical protein